jgi:nitrogen fixation NifU-like protein
MIDVGWKYTDVVKDHFARPRNVMEQDEETFRADGVGLVGSPACGDMMKLWIKVADGRIVDLKWKTFGCASAIASTSILSEMVLGNGGMCIEDAYAIRPADIVKRLGGLPKEKIHCSVLGDSALRAAIDDYRGRNGGGDK